MNHNTIIPPQNKAFIKHSSLWNALAPPPTSPIIISLVGAGGKTSTMFQLAKEISATGKRVIITTSTHIRQPEPSKDYQVILTDSHKDIESHVRNTNILVVGQEAKEHKLKGLPIDQISSLSQYADVVLIEADGAKCLPLKVPNDQEPVIIPETDIVIACVGLDCIGKKLKDTCFRSSLAAELLGVNEDHLVTPNDVSTILLHENGTRKAVGNIPYRIILNKADNTLMESYGREVIEEISRRSTEQVLLTHRGHTIHSHA